MIHVCLETAPDGAETALGELRGYQAEVDACGGYAERVDAAERLWEKKRGNKPVKIVAEMLRAMCPSSGYCMLCEDSRPSDIEHFRPKSLYPGLVFAWANFLYSCSVCNTGKGSRFRVYQGDGAVVDVTRRKGAVKSPPSPGEPLLIDPRHEDPFDFLDLDLFTGEILEREKHGLRRERARFTIAQLGLNERDFLVRARCSVYESSESVLRHVGELKRSGAAAEDIARKEQAIRRQPHRMVWEVMKRDRTRSPKLKALFDAAPEALAW